MDDIRKKLAVEIVRGVEQLALDASIQAELYPDFVSISNELVRDLSDPIESLMLDDVRGSDIFGVELWAQINALVEKTDDACRVIDVQGEDSQKVQLLSTPVWNQVRAFARSIAVRCADALRIL